MESKLAAFFKFLVIVTLPVSSTYIIGQGVCPVGCICDFNREAKTIICARLGLVAFPSNISDVVEYLDVSYNFLMEIPNDVTRLMELKSLNAARNKLSHLPDDLEKLGNLREMDLSRNVIDDVNNIRSISQLISLQTLSIADNPLKSIDGFASDTIEILNAKYCGIEELNNATLDGLPALKSLYLEGNPLKIIENPRSRKLTLLDVSACNLNYLKPDVFSGFPELVELIIADNPTLVFSTRYATLKHQTLKRLDASGCNLDRPGLHGLPMLTHAKLSENSIRLLPNRIFAKNKHLTHLYLNSNNLNHLNISTFEGLINLNVLDLSSNSLDEIHQLTFQDNVNLRYLNISFNTLPKLPKLTSSILALYASYNLITDISEDSLSHMPRLKFLDLSDNRLEEIPGGLRSPSLFNLNLRRNRLVSLSNDSFSEMPELKKLDLSGNRLTEAIDPIIFFRTPSLNNVILEDNPWRCDCSQIFVAYQYLTSIPAKTASSSLICQTPANVSGYSWKNACFDQWDKTGNIQRDRSWGFALLSLLIMLVLFGTVVSIRHTIKLKRRAAEERRQLERAEARERLRLLQRRNQLADEELQQRSEPRIHPLELMGPPSYEEAVHMPRLARSLDALDRITDERVSIRAVGSMDNLRSKKRRARRPRKRIPSEDDLLRRAERREERIRRNGRERNDSLSNADNANRTDREATRSRAASKTERSTSVLDEQRDSGSSRDRPRPSTPNAKKKLRRRSARGADTTDDEDSDIQRVYRERRIVVRELDREPRSGYRENIVQHSTRI